MLRPGRRAHRQARRPARVHALGQADPDRLRRLPGDEPVEAAQDHRRGRRLPVAHRRRRAHADARARRRDPVPARRRHPDAARRVREPAGLARRPMAARWSARWPGRSAAKRAFASQRASGRASPARRCSASCRAAPIADLRARSADGLLRWIFPATRSAAWRSANRRRRCCETLEGTLPRCCRRTSRAI